MMRCVEYWRRLHTDLHHRHAALAGRQGLHYCVATLPTLLWLRRMARQSGKAGQQGGVEGRLGWRARWGGWQAGVEGRVGWQAG